MGLVVGHLQCKHVTEIRVHLTMHTRGVARITIVARKLDEL